jgi:PAS domain-containing protein
MVVYMGVVQDVTEEHRAAEQLREQLLFIQRIASRIPGFIYQYRLHSDGTTARVQYISDAVTQFLGVTPHEVAQDHGLAAQARAARGCPAPAPLCGGVSAAHAALALRVPCGGA